jgi:hypothetical protein
VRDVVDQRHPQFLPAEAEELFEHHTRQMHQALPVGPTRNCRAFHGPQVGFPFRGIHRRAHAAGGQGRLYDIYPGSGSSI